MKHDEKIREFSISDIVKDIGEKWHSDDYYIAGDRVVLDATYKEIYKPTFYCLIIGVEGWIDFNINGQYTRIQDNTFFAHGTNVVVQRLEHSENCRIRMVLFNKKFLTNIFNNYFFIESFHHFAAHFNNCVTLNKESVIKIEDLYAALLARRTPVNSKLHIEVIRNLITSYIFEFALVVGQLDYIVEPQYELKTDTFNRFKELIYNHSSKHKDLSFYANALCISKKHLIRIVNNATGKTPTYFINEAMVSMAKMHLKKSTLSITEIATFFPFADVQTFSKFFKKNVGMSPLQYRNSPDDH